MKIVLRNAVFIMIIIFLIAGCDLITNSGRNDDKSVLPEGLKDIQKLKSTTWVSLPGQNIHGRIPDTESWYTLAFIAHDNNENEKMFGGIHYHTYNDDIRRGNYYHARYEIDVNYNINIIGGVGSTYAGVPVYENFSFGFIDDWVISNNRLFILYPSNVDDEYILEFEELTEDNPVALRYASDWYY